MSSRPTRALWKLAALWGVALVVILLVVWDALPHRAPRANVSPTAVLAPSSTASLNASASARRSAARARASATAVAAGNIRGNKLLAALNAATLNSDSAVASVGAIDLKTGEEISWQSSGFGKTVPAYSASIAKLDIAEAYLLHKADDADPLDDGEQQLFESMLTASDNDAAQTLYDELGDDLLTTLNERLGLSDTALSDDGSWGLDVTSVGDQLQLLSNLTSDGPLSADAKSYLLGLMRSVESDQRWGVGTVGTQPAVKNGWLPLADGDGWIINSVGIVTAPNGHQLQLVVISNGWESEEEGIVAVNDLVANLVKALSA